MEAKGVHVEALPVDGVCCPFGNGGNVDALGAGVVVTVGVDGRELAPAVCETLGEGVRVEAREVVFALELPEQGGEVGLRRQCGIPVPVACMSTSRIRPAIAGTRRWNMRSWMARG
jgi:hypothetical protein